MVSIDEIKDKILKIADGEGYKGEVINIIASLLSYSLYNEYISNLNLYNELNLNTAITENGRILRAAEQMYSVYRGSLPTVKFNFIPKIKLDYGKLDLVASLNKCYLYACENTNIGIGTRNYGKQEEKSNLKCYISNTPMKDAKDEVISMDNGNIYYIDVKDKNGKLAKNISEHIIVKDVDTSNNEEKILKVTRNFNEHCSSQVDSKEAEDKVFALTMPDYGVRLFRFGYIDEDGNKVGFWPSDHLIKISYLEYSDDVKYNESELERYQINGGEKPSDGTKYYEIGNAVSRDNSESIPYLANTSINMRSYIASRTDISELFKEYFIDDVKNVELKEMSSKNKRITIIYTVKPGRYIISQGAVSDFKAKYSSYLNSSGIEFDIDAQEAEIKNVTLTLDVKANSKIDSKVADILSNFEGKIETWKKEDNRLYNTTKILSMISKLDEIEYISNSLFSLTESDLKKDMDDKKFVQYKFNLIINYLN